MKVIVISNPDQLPEESKMVNALFEAGLQYFHLRKPNYSTHALRQYLEGIDIRFHNRVMIHSHHELSIPYKIRGVHLTEHHRKKKRLRRWALLKYIKVRRPDIEITAGFHTIAALKKDNPGYKYVFLSPIFDSISKVGYKSSFNEVSLKDTIATSSFNVVALGGVDENKIEKAKQLGFYGIALMGGLWKSSDPIEKCKDIMKLCNGSMH